MSTAVAEKVCKFRTGVADRIGATRFRTWFGEQTVFSVVGDEVGIAVENPFVSRWINSNYMRDLVEAGREVLGVEPQVRIYVAGPSAQGLTEDKTSGKASVAPPPAAAKTAPRDAPAQHPLRGQLDTFVVGAPNRLAYSAAETIVREPAGAMRLLVVHGGCGLGKTHLLQGICNGVRERHPVLEWRYISGEEFTNAYVYALKAARVDLFRARFRKVDLLVIDDIHFLANKKATQEEFLHTFNAIDACGKAVVLSSDRHPRSIATLSDPLINRLISGMVVEIGPPDFETRREILRQHALKMQAALADDVLDFIARLITKNVRELEGALYKLVALASLAREPIDLALARVAVEDYLDASSRPPEAGDIERIVANHFGVTREAIRSKSRDRTTSLARAMTMYLVRHHTQMSFPEIGRLLGGKNHSTVLMAVRRIEQALERKSDVAWNTPGGLKEAPAHDVLNELQQTVFNGRSLKR